MSIVNVYLLLNMMIMFAGSLIYKNQIKVVYIMIGMLHTLLYVLLIYGWTHPGYFGVYQRIIAIWVVYLEFITISIFLLMFDRLTYLIITIHKIKSDMIPFLFIMILFSLMSANMYWLLGNNQV